MRASIDPSRAFYRPELKTSWTSGTRYVRAVGSRGGPISTCLILRSTRTGDLRTSPLGTKLQLSRPSATSMGTTLLSNTVQPPIELPPPRRGSRGVALSLIVYSSEITGAPR